MGTLISAKELWSATEPERSVLIMGNSPSLNLFEDEVYDRFYTIGCNSRIFGRYHPDLTLMVDDAIPEPPPDADILTHRQKWMAHPGTVYTYRLGKRLQFHPDLSVANIDYSITSPYMAICLAYLMGWRTFTLVGVDLDMVNGKDYHDSKGAGLSDQRRRFFQACYNHLSYLIKKMSKYHHCRFFSLSPHTQLFQNGYVQKATV